MSDAIEILKKIFETNKSVMFEDEKEALKKGILALEQKEKLIKYCNELEANNKNAVSKTLCWEFIGTCKVKQILGIKKEKGVSK